MAVLVLRNVTRTANWLSDWANMVLVCSLVAGVAATFVVVRTGNIKERYWEKDRQETISDASQDHPLRDPEADVRRAVLFEARQVRDRLAPPPGGLLLCRELERFHELVHIRGLAGRLVVQAGNHDG